ncbi:rhomboid family intramembrane serine protease [Haliangium sp.]|uniref:rhomboid family intramembrane serine protease n=1 Tax=Haliangium sp. TaxID=2663208 RepID=UPI003D131664
MRNLSITRGALGLLFVEVGLSLVYLMSDDQAKAALASWVVASADQVWGSFKLWTLVTTSLFEIDFISLIFHALILWMFMPTLERWWGMRKFLLFALWTCLAGNTAASLAGLALGGGVAITGLDPFVFAAIVAFGILYAKQPVQFFGVLPMTGRQMMIGIIAFVGLFIVIGAQWVIGVGYLAAMGVSWLLVSGKWQPRLWYLRWKHKRARRHLKVVDRGRDDQHWMN